MTIGAHPVRQAGPTPTSAKQVSPTSWSISGSPEARSSHRLCECRSLWLRFLSLFLSFSSSLFISLVISPALSPCLSLRLYLSKTIDLSLFPQLDLILSPILSFPNSVCLSPLLCLLLSPTLSQLFCSLFLSLTLYLYFPNSISLYLLKHFLVALSFL